MGTGIVSIILHAFSEQYPEHHGVLHVLSIAFFVLNCVLFTIIMVITVLRYTLYPATWSLMLSEPTQSLFLGTIPMGFATIVNMFVAICVPSWGGVTWRFAWGMWWLDVVVSVVICFGLPFQMMTKHRVAHETMTAVWLLPVVSTIVAAASGAVVADCLPDPRFSLWTILTSYVLWGTGVPIAFVIMTIYFHRLTVHKLPPQAVIASVFLPLGPMGQGGYGIMELGAQAKRIFPDLGTLHPAAGEILYVQGWLIAIIMWGFGLLWFFLAVASISRSKFPFNMGWWGFTFPLGTFAMSTLTMAQELPSQFFKILGTIFGTCVILLWFVVMAGTVKNILYGQLFEAPCLKSLEKECARAKSQKEERETV
ncbi:C4-dicarboxylate transporter/malic acid transport protein [Amniculicola lignicola CBS 123094]|uniref:Sulfite efflux pump SSU1 n=1 Tax=Amniculicola lignicola CBS 123094 TaxID=1392246 RepID=A0A6A5W6N8_9PLEO|nr:C4-dicarboxylate transporter/malic acid transport protein [Amniculicola lignicola CBS 123094]